jgi:hypothetical protein
MNPVKNLKLDLLDNAYSYLNASLENLVNARESGDQQLWKFAILNISLSIELFLKERLRRDHPLLIYANINNYRPITPDTRTVSWNSLISRLKYILGDNFDKVDAGRLQLSRTLRNRIIHYEVELKFPNVYHTYANLHNFVVEFFDSYIKENPDEKLRDHIRSEFWPEEQGLYYVFVEELVFYNGIFMTLDLKQAIIDEQNKIKLRIDGELFDRIRYGS